MMLIEFINFRELIADISAKCLIKIYIYFKMKKKILGGIIAIVLVVVIAAFCAMNIYFNSGKSNLSEMATINIEALASSEGGNGCSATPCGGPDNNGRCQASNCVNCKDLYGCQ
jgi:hypothetical protein